MTDDNGLKQIFRGKKKLKLNLKKFKSGLVKGVETLSAKLKLKLVKKPKSLKYSKDPTKFLYLTNKNVVFDK